MLNPAIEWAIIITEVVALGFLDLFSFVPMLASILLKKVEKLHEHCVSDIPGNPHAFDAAVISLFRTLPEPSNFNIVWTSVPLEEPLIVRGELPLARFSSLSIYGQGSADPPNSLDLQEVPLGKNKSFAVSLGPEKGGEGPFLHSNKWKRGFCVMRNYLVPPGTVVNTPELVRARDGSIVRRSQRLVGGPATLDLRPSHFVIAIKKMLKFNAAVAALNYPIFQCCWKKATVFVVLAGATLAFGMYQLCFFLGKKRLYKFSKEICYKPNELKLASLEQGSKTSQPSRLHKYWIMHFDIPAGAELSVTGRIHRRQQMYWSLVVYDEYGLPLPQYVYDANVTEIPCAEGEGGGGEVYSYDIRMRNNIDCSNHSYPYKRNDKWTDVDVSSSPKGFVLFRLVHPINDQVEVFSAPSTKLVNDDKKNC